MWKFQKGLRELSYGHKKNTQLQHRRPNETHAHHSIVILMDQTLKTTISHPCICSNGQSTLRSIAIIGTSRKRRGDRKGGRFPSNANVLSAFWTECCRECCIEKVVIHSKPIKFAS